MYKVFIEGKRKQDKICKSFCFKFQNEPTFSSVLKMIEKHKIIEIRLETLKVICVK